MRTGLLNRIRKREKELAEEREDLADQGLELDDVEIYLNRLEAGLLSLQLADYVLAWVCMEDDGVSRLHLAFKCVSLLTFGMQARDHAKETLAKQGTSFAEVIKVLQEYQDNIGDVAVGGTSDDHSTDSAAPESAAEADAANKRQIIAHLISYLRSC